jgi:hypothetical protein
MLNESKLKDYIRSFVKNFVPSKEELGQSEVAKNIPMIDPREFHKLLRKIGDTLYEGHGSKKHFKQLSKEDEDFFGEESDKLPEFFGVFKAKETHAAFSEVVANILELNPKHKEEDKLYKILNDYYKYYYRSSDNDKIFNPKAFSEEISNDCEIFLRMLKVVE